MFSTRNVIGWSLHCLSFLQTSINVICGTTDALCAKVIGVLISEQMVPDLVIWCFSSYDRRNILHILLELRSFKILNKFWSQNRKFDTSFQTAYNPFMCLWKIYYQMLVAIFCCCSVLFYSYSFQRFAKNRIC